jgi:hypothetical protein
MVCGGERGASLRRRPAFPHRTLAPFRCALLVQVSAQRYSLWGPPAGTAIRSTGVCERHHITFSLSSLPPLPQTSPLFTSHNKTKAVSAIPKTSPHPSVFLHTVCRMLSYLPAPRAGCPSRGLSTVTVRPIIVFHAFVNDAAEAGQDQISLSLGTGLVSRYGIAVPPMAADLCFITAPRHPLIAGRLRTRTAFNQYLKRVHSPSWVGALHGIIAQLAFLFATAERDHSLVVTTSKYITGNFKITTIPAEISFHRCSLFST